MKMKTKTLFYMALTAVMTTLAACSQDDELMDAAPKQAQIEFEITDGGYGGDEATRAVEEGFCTKFETGDKCGLYIIDNGEFIASNVKLTAEAGENGEITWKAADGDISGVTDKSKYFLYYPYKSLDIVDAQLGDDDTKVFKNLIDRFCFDWYQYTQDLYTQSDLMTATGTASTGADGKLKVSFSLTHQMALAVIELPKTVYKFTNEDVTIPDYTVASSVDFSGSDYKPFRMEDGTYRFVFNSDLTGIRSITGTVNGNKKFTISADKLGGIDRGTYKTFRIGGGTDGTPIEKDYTLQVGDYLMKDGNLIKKDETLTAEQKADVAAIVFYAPNISERETPASLTDDKIMAAEHPNCNHGLAVAVQELTYQGSNTMAWQTKAEKVERFRNSSNFTHANKDKFVSIATFPLTKNEGNFTKIYGYQNTQVLFAYNDYCTKNSMTDNIVKPAAAIAGFTDANPAPTGSTGWFIPSAKEMHILCFKDGDTVLDSGENHTVTRDKVNESLTAVGGDVFGDGYYWSSSETDTEQIDVKFSTAGFYGQIKTMGRLVRCVCAF